jgi:folate-binding protein YgfZ
VFCAPENLPCAAAGRRAAAFGELMCLDWSGERARCLLLGPEPALAQLPDAVSAIAWELEDLAHGLPRLRATDIDTHTPQRLGLDRLQAYSVKKGCYPGQEIVARTHFLGQGKRGLRRLQSVTPLSVGQELVLDGERFGSVLCAATDGSRNEALAVLPLELDATDLHAIEPAVAPVHVIGFAEGLAR